MLIILRSFTNFAKLFGDDAMMVVFGRILRGPEVAVPAVLIGAFMLVTGVAMLMGSRWAFPMITAYAGFVAVNLLAWTVINPEEFVRVGKQLSSATDDAAARRAGVLGFLGYCVIALGTTAGPAWVMWRGRRPG